MELQYKLIVSNRSVYKEFEITAEMQEIILGTTSACEFRLNPDDFFTTIELKVLKKEKTCVLECGDNIYISKGDLRKLLSTELIHGDVFSVCYEESGNVAFQIRFLIDFEAQVPDYNWKIDLQGKDYWLFSGEESADIQFKGKFSSACSIAIRKNSAGYEVEELYSEYGIYQNGQKMGRITNLENRDFIFVAEFSFYYKDNYIFFDKKGIVVHGPKMQEVQPRRNSFRYPLYNRNTRLKYIVPDEKINLLIPPGIPKKPESNLAMTLLPAIAMLVLTIAVRGYMSNVSNNSFIIFSVCTILLGIGTSIATFIQSKKKYKVECRTRIEKYADYAENKREEIAEDRQTEAEILKEIYHDLNYDMKTVINFSEELFDRMKKDEDFLHVYLGVGRAKAIREIDYKEQETFEIGDELMQIPHDIAEHFAYLDNVPIWLNLLEINAVGIIGTKEKTHEFLKNMVLDLAVRQYYGDIQMILLADDMLERYEWAKYLPHLFNERETRNIVYDTETKNNVFESLYKELIFRSEQKDNSEATYFIVFVMDERGIKNHPLARFIERAAELRVVFIFFETYRENLPLSCDQIIQLQENNNGWIAETKDCTQTKIFQYDTITDTQMVKLCRKLAPVYCEEISLESSLRKNISLFELLHIYSVEDIDLKERWGDSRVFNSMAAPLGVNAKNEIVFLDLHEKAHGPHGLVAGTTGSGKSEILQTFILSAATLFHPYEVSFVIIDFKGGGMVNQFKDLPHLIGAITNIDGREIDRSLKSIKAELLKRQELFAQANVNHIDKYIKLYKEHKVAVALPHLIIIVDEFAELKAEQPEFMKELISAARIGRSLGVHLILATQKPSGQVNEQIWSNSKFKLCLKVQTREDSNEVLKSPLAAEIKEPGRAYLQVGNNEIFELLQSAYSGAPEKSEEGMEERYVISQVALSGKRTKIFEHKPATGNGSNRTQLEAIVDYINDYCEKNSISKLSNICLPPLTEHVVYQYEAENEASEMMVPLGVYDDPEHQYQGTFFSDFGRQNTIIIGASQMGKTNVLQLLIRSLADHNSPDQVSLYIMDFGSMVLKCFENLKHVGGVVLAAEDEKLKNLFKMLMTEMDIRKTALMNFGVSSYSAYKDAGGKNIPKTYLIIDNFNAFKELYLDNYEADFIKLCRDGVSLGISVIITNASSNGIGYRHMSNFENHICLTCVESTEYSSMFDRCRMEPKSVPGRVLIESNHVIYELQVFLAFEGEKEIERSNAMKNYINTVNDKYKNSKKAKVIPEIPQKLSRSCFDSEYKEKMEANYVPVGLDFASIEPVIINLKEDQEIVFVAKKKEMSMPFMNSFINTMLVYANVEMYIIDSFVRGMKKFANMPQTQEYTLDLEQCETIFETISNKLQARKERLIAGEEIQGEPTQVIIIHNKDAFAYISDTKPVRKLFDEITKDYKNYGVFVIYGDVEDEAVPYGSPDILKHLKDAKQAVVFDNLPLVKLYDVSSQFARKHTKPLLEDEAYWFRGPEIKKVKLITEDSEKEIS